MNDRFLYLSLCFCLILFNACKRDTTLPPNTFVDDRDGQRYTYIEVDGAVWMAQNMNYNILGSQYNDDNPFSEYGRLYTFEQAKDACPNGWHLPTEAEWKVFEYSLGMAATELNALGYRGHNIGSSFKSKDGWIQGSGDNAFMFNVYPAGYYNNNDKNFYDIGRAAKIWTASDSGSTTGWFRGLSDSFSGINRYWTSKNDHLSCRCMQDE